MIASPGLRSRDPASLRPQPKRDGSDYWPTPPCLINALIEHVAPTWPPATIWEMAAGDGRVAKALRAAGYCVFASDIEPRGDGIERIDFLRGDPPEPRLIACTNPPNNQLTAFISRGLQLLDANRIAGLVLLVRYDALTAASRAAAFNRASSIVTCCWRPLWIEGTRGNGRWSNAWISWLADHSGSPKASWILPKRKQRQPTLDFTA
jgi:hypothetical protein